MTAVMKRYEVVNFDDVLPATCPCGQTRRAFTGVEDFPATIHRVEISKDAQTHYHKRLTETYYVLECGPGAAIELDGQRVPVRAGSCVMIRPGVRHRAIGTMTILNIVVPKFDAEDEWFD